MLFLMRIEFDFDANTILYFQSSDRPDCTMLRENDHFMFCGDSAGKVG